MKYPKLRLLLIDPTNFTRFVCDFSNPRKSYTKYM